MSSSENYPNHSLETKRGDIRSYLSPNKSTILKINTKEVKSIESTDSQKVIHLNKTKTIIKSLNLENNLNGFTSDNSIVVYRLSSTKDLIKKSVPNCSESTQSLETNPHKKRYLVSQRSGKVYEIVGNRSAVKREATEPDTDLITDEEYFQYLNLIGSKRLKSEHKSSLNEWPLRTLSKVVSTPVYDINGDILLTDVCPKPGSSETNTSEDKSEVSRRKLAKSQWLTEVKDSSNKLDDQIDRFRDESTRKREKLMKEWQTNALNTISFFGLSSYMGMRLFRTLYRPMNKLETYVKICDFEQFCLDNVLKHLLTFNHFYGFNGVSRITRSRDSNDWNPRYYQHKYCFTRTQQLEKYKQLETGLNWRSRLLKSQCKRALIKIHKIKWCPICSKDIEYEYSHQCYEYEPNLRPTNSRNPSKVCDSSNELIIGDDFFNEDFTQNNDIFENNNNFNEEMVVVKEEVKQSKEIDVITADDDEDDDIMIVEEVFKTKERNIVLKSLLTSNISQKTAVSYKKPSIMSFSQKSSFSRSPSDQRGCQTLLSLLTSDSNPESNRFKKNDFVFASHSSKNS